MSERVTLAKNRPLASPTDTAMKQSKSMDDLFGSQSPTQPKNRSSTEPRIPQATNIDELLHDANSSRKAFEKYTEPFRQNINTWWTPWSKNSARNAIQAIEDGDFSTSEAVAERLKELEVLENSYGFARSSAPAKTWGSTLYDAAAAVGNAVMQAGTAVAEWQFVGPKITALKAKLNKTSLEDMAEDRALLVNGRRNRVAYEKWSRDNLIQDLNKGETAEQLLANALINLKPDQVLKEVRRHHNISPAAKARLQQYESETTGPIFGITVNVASRITKTTLRGIPAAAQKGAFDHLLSPTGMNTTITALNRFADQIASPSSDDPRTLKLIKKETEKSFKTAAEKIAYTLIPSGWNPLNWVKRKLLMNGLQTYYFGELSERAYAGKKGADTFLEPAVKYLQSAKGFDPKNTDDNKINALRINAFAGLVSSIANQLGTAQTDTKNPIDTKKIGDLLGKVDLQKIGGVGDKTHSWTSWLGGFNTVQNSIDSVVQNSYQQAVQETLLPWLKA